MTSTADVPTPAAGVATMRLIGRPVTRVDAVAKATGAATYGVDVRFPGMLTGRVLRAGVPHARIEHIDVSGAWEVPGVRAVITGADHSALHGPMVKDQPALATDRVRYAGEVVAAVAADDEDAATEAVDRIAVEYDELPVVDTFDDALAERAPLVHERPDTYEVGDVPGFRIAPVPGSNVAYHFKLRHGDVERGFEQSHLVVEDTFETQFLQYCHLEPHVVVAHYDAMDVLTLWTSTMGPHTLRNMMAGFLGMPASSVRVITNMIGGAYGGKMYLRAINPVAALLARKVRGRHVRVAFDREDEFLTSPGRLPARMTVKTGVDRDGHLLARQATIHWNKGAYLDLGAMVVRNAGYVALGPYRIPNARVDGYALYTNRQPGGAFRGLGVPQVAWAGEQQLDRIARELGLSPLDLRRRNVLDDGDVSVTGETMRDVGARACLDAVADELGGLPLPTPSRDGALVGRGLALIIKSTLTPTATFATVRLNDDGSVDLITAAVEHGQGSMTVLAQIVAEELAVPFERVRFVMPDTSVAPFDRSSSSSRTVFTMGNALRKASAEVRTKLLEMAGDVLEANSEDLEIVDGRVAVKGTPTRSESYRDIIRATYKGPGNVIGEGDYATKPLYDSMDPDTAHSARPSVFWMYAACGADVEVDEETGELRVVRLATAVDAGKALNPQGCLQQVTGSAVMGLGMATTEEVVFDEGRVMNPTFLDYKVPTTVDLPEMHDLVVETAAVDGPYGARGVGEPGTAAVPAAVGNAVYDAIAVQIRSLPLRAETIFRMLRERLGGGR